MKALITGANSVVNKAMLERLVSMGYEVVAHYHSDNDITKELKEKHNCTFVQADFADPASVNAFMDVVKKHGPFDVIVNGAVYYSEVADWTVQQDYNAWQKNFSINTTVPGLLMANADTLMNKGGVIVNISSTFGQTYMGDLQFTMYSASKAALDLLTETYAKRWYPDVRIVGIAPGWIRSKWNMDMTEGQIKEMVEPHRTQLIEPGDIASLMEQVIANKGINATTILIDSGISSPVV